MAEDEGKSMGDLIEEAKQHVLTEIPKLSGGGKSHRILHLAEAYAWLTSPAQPHGGPSSSD